MTWAVCRVLTLGCRHSTDRGSNSEPGRRAGRREDRGEDHQRRIQDMEEKCALPIRHDAEHRTGVAHTHYAVAAG